MNAPDILAEIDATIEATRPLCSWQPCSRPLPAECPSEWWCSQDCQRRWTACNSEPLPYRWDDESGLATAMRWRPEVEADDYRARRPGKSLHPTLAALVPSEFALRRADGTPQPIDAEQIRFVYDEAPIVAGRQHEHDTFEPGRFVAPTSGYYLIHTGRANGHQALLDVAQTIAVSGQEACDAMRRAMEHITAEIQRRAAAAWADALPVLRHFAEGLDTDQPPTDPRGRALWLRQHRNTGPKPRHQRPPRAIHPGRTS